MDKRPVIDDTTGMKAIVLATLLPVSALAAESKPAVLGHLETQNRVITIFAGEKPTYTVATKDGKVLAERITPEQLQKKDAELAKFLRDALAPRAGIADASLRR